MVPRRSSAHTAWRTPGIKHEEEATECQKKNPDRFRLARSKKPETRTTSGTSNSDDAAVEPWADRGRQVARGLGFAALALC